MTSPFSDEMISAYLDGEVTAQQQARVEQQLREDAGLRKMCDELRALRSTLQSIPIEDPPEGLAERVLRQAERRILLGEEKRDQRNAQAATATTDNKLARSKPPVHRYARLAVGFVVSAAALILVAILFRGPDQQALTSNAIVKREQMDPAENGELQGGVSEPTSSPSASEAMPGSELAFRRSKRAIAPLMDEAQELDMEMATESAESLNSTGVPREAISKKSVQQQRDTRSKAVAGEETTAKNTPTSDSGSARARRSRYGAGIAGGGGTAPSAGRGAARGGYGGLPPADGPTAGQKTDRFEYRKEFKTPQMQVQSGPILGGAIITKPAVFPDPQQLVRQLVADRNLLVQVRLRKGSHELSLAPFGIQPENENRLRETARQLWGNDDVSHIELRMLSQRGQAQINKKLPPDIGKVIVVEGTRDSVCDSLDRLIRRAAGNLRMEVVREGAAQLRELGVGTTDAIAVPPALPRVAAQAPDDTDPAIRANRRDNAHAAEDARATRRVKGEKQADQLSARSNQPKEKGEQQRGPQDATQGEHSNARDGEDGATPDKRDASQWSFEKGEEKDRFDRGNPDSPPADKAKSSMRAAGVKPPADSSVKDQQLATEAKPPLRGAGLQRQEAGGTNSQATPPLAYDSAQAMTVVHILFRIRPQPSAESKSDKDD